MKDDSINIDKMSEIDMAILEECAKISQDNFGVPDVMLDENGYIIYTKEIESDEQTED